MQRQRGELVPIGEAIGNLSPAKTLRETSPPARRGFTLADQVEQLVTASEAGPERAFMARMMALCSLPRSNPGTRTQYVRRKRPLHLGDERNGFEQTSLWQPAPLAHGLDLQRGS